MSTALLSGREQADKRIVDMMSNFLIILSFNTDYKDYKERQFAALESI
jgi:hypothetical protein